MKPEKTIEKIFRILLLITTISYFMWYFQPYNIPTIYDENVIVALSWNGYGANAIISTYGPWFLIGLFSISAGGLWLFITEARYLFLSFIIIGLLLSPFWGLSIQTNIDNIFSYLFVFLSGVILSMSFFSPVSQQFKTLKALKWSHDISSSDLPAIDEQSFLYQLIAIVRTYKIASWCFAFLVGILFRYSYGCLKHAIWQERSLSSIAGLIAPFSESQLLLFNVVMNFVVDVTSSLIPAFICGALLIYILQERARFHSIGTVAVILILDSRLWSFWQAPNLGMQISALMGSLLSVLVFISAVWILLKIRNRKTLPLSHSR